jgi:hypothetical protein
VLFHHFANLIFVFIQVFSFVHIIAVLFDLFSCFYCFLSHIYIYMDCTAKLVLFGVGFSFARTARR